jgi:hypothetical protein
MPTDFEDIVGILGILPGFFAVLWQHSNGPDGKDVDLTIAYPFLTSLSVIAGELEFSRRIGDKSRVTLRLRLNQRVVNLHLAYPLLLRSNALINYLEVGQVVRQKRDGSPGRFKRNPRPQD